MGRSINQAALGKFAQSVILLARRVRAEATPLAMRDLTSTQRSVLIRLETEGPAISAALAREEGITPQSMGTALAALEQLGYVERTPHPTDGRQTLMSLTADGKAMRKTARKTKEKWLHAAISTLDQDEREALLRAGEIIQRMLDRAPRATAVAAPSSRRLQASLQRAPQQGT